MGNSLRQLSSCSSSSSAEIVCMPQGDYSLGSGCAGGGGVIATGKARVVHTGIGEVMEANEGTTAAELMMEHPNHFLICSTATTIAPGKRFMPLASHHELARNHVYFLLPMHKLRCRLSTKDLDLLSHLSSKLKRVPTSDLTRIHPFISPPSCCLKRAAAALSHLHTVRVAAVAEQVMLCKTGTLPTPPPTTISGLWRPSLQTIDETPHLLCRSWTATQVFRPR